jgi:hypothetical protein
MAKKEWLYCNYDWNDMIDVIKAEKNCDKRLHKFHNILAEEDITVQYVVDSWDVIDKSDIKDRVDEWFYNYDLEDAANGKNFVYWFFNIYTGEALHIECSINVSDMIVD